MFGRVGGWIEVRVDGGVDGWTSGWVDGRVSVWTSGWMDGWMIEWTRVQWSNGCAVSVFNLAVRVLSAGSIIVDFSLLPPINGSGDSNEEVIARLRALIKNGTIDFKPQTVEPTWFKTWTGKIVNILNASLVDRAR